MLKNRTFENFESASRAVLNLLHKRLGFDLWMVTRVEGNNWIVLQAEDHGYGVQEGQVFNWADSFCSQMVLDRGPCIATNSLEVPAYAAAPIGRQIKIGAYVGVPLVYADGTLFGTLCAIHPESKPSAIADELPMVELLARMLCTILNNELKFAEQARLVERIQVDAITDTLTGLYNRRGWDRLLTAEESRCRRYGHSACVAVIDLDDLKKVNDTQSHADGDELIRKAAQAIQNSVRTQDVVARVGGDEFFVLGVECNENGSMVLENRLRDALTTAGVSASIGLAIRNPNLGLHHAVKSADAKMYFEKKARKAGR